MLRDGDVELVKSSVNMVQLAEAYGLKVNRKGYAVCPFHDDKHPSMRVFSGYTSGDGFYCYTCAKGGDIIKFVREYEGLGFEAATRRIAEMFCIPISDGGEMSQEDKRRAAEAIKAREREKEQKAAEEHRRRTLAKYLTMLKVGIEKLPPMSDAWCNCQNELPVALYQWEVINGIDT